MRCYEIKIRNTASSRFWSNVSVFLKTVTNKLIFNIIYFQPF